MTKKSLKSNLALIVALTLLFNAPSSFARKSVTPTDVYISQANTGVVDNPDHITRTFGVPLGTKVLMLDKRENWVKIQWQPPYSYQILSGWVKSKNLQQTPYPNLKGVPVFVTAPRAVLRQSPNEASQELGSLLINTRLQQLGAREGWVRVQQIELVLSNYGFSGWLRASEVGAAPEDIASLQAQLSSALEKNERENAIEKLEKLVALDKSKLDLIKKLQELYVASGDTVKAAELQQRLDGTAPFFIAINTTFNIPKLALKIQYTPQGTLTLLPISYLYSGPLADEPSKSELLAYFIPQLRGLRWYMPIYKRPGSEHPCCEVSSDIYMNPVIENNEYEGIDQRLIAVQLGDWRYIATPFDFVTPPEYAVTEPLIGMSVHTIFSDEHAELNRLPPFLLPKQDSIERVRLFHNEKKPTLLVQYKQQNSTDDSNQASWALLDALTGNALFEYQPPRADVQSGALDASMSTQYFNDYLLDNTRDMLRIENGTRKIFIVLTRGTPEIPMGRYAGFDAWGFLVFDDLGQVAYATAITSPPQEDKSVAPSEEQID